MANYYLPLYEKTEGRQKVGDSKSITFSFDGESQLTIYMKGRSYTRLAMKGDLYVVHCSEGIPRLERQVMPKRDHKLILWLCGFNHNNSEIRSRYAYEQKLHKQREKLHWEGYEENVKETPDYAFVTCKRKESFSNPRVAGYVDEKLILTKQVVVEIFNAYYEVGPNNYPPQFVQAVLERRFGIEKDDFDQIIFPGK